MAQDFMRNRLPPAPVSTSPTANKEIAADAAGKSNKAGNKRKAAESDEAAAAMGTPPALDSLVRYLFVKH